jgi:L-fuculose-phosphate aldolase
VLHLETVLHTGVYRVRPDVGAVVHGHPPYATALGATTAELAVLTHDGILFADGVARFDDPDLIVDDDQGERVASALGDRRAVLLNNHGVLVVGKDVPWAVLTAATLERAARLQSVASTLGPLSPIGRDLARELLPVKYRDEFVDEYWSAWLRSVVREGGGLGGDRA